MTPSGQLILTTMCEAIKAGHITFDELVQGVASSAPSEYKLNYQDVRGIKQSLVNGDVYASQIVDFVVARNPIDSGAGSRIEVVAYVRVLGFIDAPAPTSQNLLPE